MIILTLPTSVSIDYKPCCAVAGRNLFRRAVLLSGSALTTWAVARRSLHYAQLVAARLNCTDAGDAAAAAAAFLPCLKRLPVEDVARLDVRAPRYLSAFGPTIDGRAVLPEDMAHLMVRTSESVLAGTALLAGVARHEGLAFLRQSDVVVHDDPPSPPPPRHRDRWRKSLRTFVQVRASPNSASSSPLGREMDTGQMSVGVSRYTCLSLRKRPRL